MKKLGKRVTMSVRLLPEQRRVVELLSAHYTVELGRHCTMAEVLHRAIELLAKEEGVTAKR